MYFLTALNKNFDKRCFGYLPSKEEALGAVFNNLGNMHEGHFDFLVVEKIYPGVHGGCGEQIWFKWKKGWQNIKRPAWSVGIRKWSIR